MQVISVVTRQSYIKSVKDLFIFSYKRHVLLLMGVSLFMSLLQNRDDFTLKNFLSTTLIYFAILFVISVFSSFLKSYKKLKKQLQELGSKTITRVFTINENGLNVKVEDHEIVYGWYAIKKVKAIAGYISISLNNNATVIIPISSFNSSEQASIFLDTCRNNLIRNEIPSPKPQYYWGLLGLVPVAGAVNGLIMTISGISKYRDAKYIIIGLSGILVNALYFGILIYYLNGGSLTNGKFLRSGFADMSQMQLNSLVKEVEFYKLQNGVYPDSLRQLELKNGLINIHDPVLDNSKKNIYNYHKIGNKYTLFSSGIDEIPNTADDIYPSIKIDTNKMGLIIKR